MEEGKALFVIKKSDAIEKINTEIDTTIEGIKGIVVSDNDTMKKAGDAIILGKKLAKKLEKERKDHVAPYKKVIKDYESTVNVLIEKCKKLVADTTPGYQAYVTEQERKETERLAKIKEAEAAKIKAEAEAQMSHVLSVSEANGIDMTEQAIAIEQKAKEDIQKVASQKIDVSITNRSNIGTLSTTKTYKGEVYNIVDALRYIAKTIEDGFDISDCIKFQPSGLNKLAGMKKKSIIESGGEIRANGIRLYENRSLGGR